jgi:hypothetical protein
VTCNENVNEQGGTELVTTGAENYARKAGLTIEVAIWETASKK